MAALGQWVSTSQAQTIKVVKKQGQPVAFDVSKLDSITFQSITPGFTVYGNDSTAQYTFDKVESIKSSADFLFSHPDTIYVGDTRGKFSFQMNTNVDYDIEPSAGWLYYDGKITGTDSLRFISGNNPMMKKRTGYIYFVNKADDTMRDTLVVVQTGKGDSHFIDIDWATTTVNSFNETTGQCVLTFQGEVPEMGEYDAFLLPTTTSYIIRLVNTVAHAEGSKTVTLGTREGKMGNLFKNQSFTLCTDPNYNPNASEAKARDAGIANAPVFYPETIELCVDGQPFAEIYRRNSSEGSEEGAASALHTNAPRRATELQKDFNIYELNYDKSGDVIWESGSHSVSWDKCTFDVGLKGVFYFNFGDTEWEKVRFGDLQVLKAYLEGDFNTELILKYALSKSAEFSWEKTLKEDLFSYRVKFMVGTIPVWINISSDLKASVEAGAEGTVTVTSGVTANANVKAGLQWDKVSGVTPINEFTYGYELVEPEVEAEAHAEAVEEAVAHGILAGEHLGSAENDAVYDYKAEEHAEGLIQTGQKRLNKHLHQRYEGGDYDYVAGYADLVRDYVPQKRDDHVGAHENEGQREAHTEAAQHRYGNGQHRAGPKADNFFKPVYDSADICTDKGQVCVE